MEGEGKQLVIAKSCLDFLMVITQGPIVRRSEFCRSLNRKQFDDCVAALASVDADEFCWVQPKPDDVSYPEMADGTRAAELGCPPFKSTVLRFRGVGGHDVTCVHSDVGNTWQRGQETRLRTNTELSRTI